MAKPKVLLLGNIDHAHKTLSALSSLADLITPTSTSRQDFLAELASPHLSTIVAAYRTFASVTLTGIWDSELVAALPPSFKLVTHNGAGYDQLHIPPLTARSIVACHVPTAVDDATADTALFLMLGALRNFNPSLLTLRRGEFRGTPPPALGHDPQGKVLGVLGMGGIGRNLARKCRALGMQVVYHNRHRLSEAKEDGARYVGFEELLRQSDVVSVHVPLNPGTRHLLDAKALGMMKKGCTIVNTARGAVIDEAALVEKLAEGHVRSVGLDVYEEEPRVHEGLVGNPNVLLLPHMGTWTVETQEKMEEWCIGNISGFLEGRQDISVVPEQKAMWKKMVDEGKVRKVEEA